MALSRGLCPAKQGRGGCDGPKVRPNKRCRFATIKAGGGVVDLPEVITEATRPIAPSSYSGVVDGGRLRMKPGQASQDVVTWQFFGTFVFHGKVREAIGATMFFSAMRKEASFFRVHFKQLLWCVRRESGEISGREHLHALIAGLPAYAITERSCRGIEARWASFGGASAVVRVFNRSLDGPAYILKGLEQAFDASQQGVDLKEFTKFSRSSEITLSESVIRVAMSRRLLGKRSRLRTTPREVSLTPDSSQVRSSLPEGPIAAAPAAREVPAPWVRFVGLGGHYEAVKGEIQGDSRTKGPATLPVVTSGMP